MVKHVIAHCAKTMRCIIINEVPLKRGEFSLSYDISHVQVDA